MTSGGDTLALLERALHQTAAVINDRVGAVGATRPVAGPLWEAAHAMGTAWGLQPRVFAWLFDLMRERGVTFPS